MEVKTAPGKSREQELALDLQNAEQMKANL